MKNKIILVTAFLLTACSTIENKLISKNMSHEQIISNMTAICLGFSKAGYEKEYGLEIDIFNECMDTSENIIKENFKMIKKTPL